MGMVSWRTDHDNLFAMLTLLAIGWVLGGYFTGREVAEIPEAPAMVRLLRIGPVLPRPDPSRRTYPPAAFGGVLYLISRELIMASN